MQVSGSLFAPSATAGGASRGIASSSAEEQFLTFARKTPAEQMREKILASMGLTDEDVRAMAPKQREQVEAKIKEMIKAQIENDPHMRQGSFLDVKA